MSELNTAQLGRPLVDTDGKMAPVWVKWFQKLKRVTDTAVKDEAAARTAGDAAGTAALAAHVAAADPHTGYQKESEKNAASGYAGLDAGSKLAGAQQIYGTVANTATEGNDARIVALLAAVAALPVLVSGTYTPSLTNIANLTSSSAASCQYLRVGNTVTVSGKINAQAVAGGSTLTYLKMSLPIASTFTGENEAGGMAGGASVTGLFATISGVSGSAQVYVMFRSTDTNDNELWFTFTYRVN